MKIINENIRKEIVSLLDRFLLPDSLSFISQSMFKRGLNIPSDNWSTLNRLIMLNHGTFDARGPRAWFAMGRKVLKASHFCIMRPLIMKKKAQTKDEEDKIFIRGFSPICVWPAEKTTGKEIDYKIPTELPDFAGKELAESWGIEIEQSFQNPIYYGFYSETKSKKKITMCTNDQQTFFHELVHAADFRLNGQKKFYSDKRESEIVAEFSSAVLMGMFGLKFGDKNVHSYIKSYAKNKDQDAIDCVIPCISRITKLVSYIIDETNKLVLKVQA